MQPDSDGISVTVLSGSLGAGKTTLLNHLLETAADRDLAVLVNDMGEVNVDATLVAEGSNLDTGGVTELSNGCICCELQDDLETAVVRLARNREFDHLLVESSGISEPEPVAQLFTTASRVAASYDLDALVTVLDTRRFLDAFAGKDVPERQGTAPGQSETDDAESRPLSDLLIEQLEVANLVLLNKTDLCTDAELEEAASLVRALQPDAEMIRTEFSTVPPDRLLGIDLFDAEQMGELAGWQRALDDDQQADTADSRDATEHQHQHPDNHNGHRHPDDVYGVQSFVFRERRPFHPERFASFLRDLPESIVRSKGTAWIAGHETKVELSQAGPSIRATGIGPWIGALPDVDQQLYRSNRPDLEWHDEHGDRQTELVFIGTAPDEDALRSQLRACLVTDDEWDTAAGLESPFPAETDAEIVVREP